MTTLTDVTSNGSDLDAGQTVTFTLTASEALTIATGAALTLSNGATAVYNSTTGKFVYTVAAGHDTSDLTVTGYSGSITDAAGNALAPGGVTLDTRVKIDTVAPTVTTLTDVTSNSNESGCRSDRDGHADGERGADDRQWRGADADRRDGGLQRQFRQVRLHGATGQDTADLKVTATAGRSPMPPAIRWRQLA